MRLKALNQSELLNDDSIEIIAIAREESAETVIAWRDENGIKTPLAADPGPQHFQAIRRRGCATFYHGFSRQQGDQNEPGRGGRSAQPDRMAIAIPDQTTFAGEIN